MIPVRENSEVVIIYPDIFKKQQQWPHDFTDGSSIHHIMHPFIKRSINKKNIFIHRDLPVYYYENQRMKIFTNQINISLVEADPAHQPYPTARHLLKEPADSADSADRMRTSCGTVGVISKSLRILQGNQS